MSEVLSVLGSTGSIGTQTLDVARQCGFRIAALTANRSVALLEQQAREFKPKLVVAYDAEAAADLKIRLADTDIRVATGMEGLVEAATLEEADTVVTAVMGMIGLRPTLAAIDAHKRIALANKETLVCAGELVMRRAQEQGVDIVPVDSEHSAIFQCLQGSADRGEVKRLILTASGGPFFGWTRDQLKNVTRADALKHPNWSMGAKITIDSATLMNKGLEFIEAMRLYQMRPEQIQIVVHRQSIIHSLVEYNDHAVLAQLGTADMRLPIQYALTWPRRTQGAGTELDLFSCPSLTFERPDPETFRCLGIALETARKSGTACAIMNGANEAAVDLFLRDRIGFLDIAQLVEYALDTVPAVGAEELDAVLEADRAAREAVYSRLG
jgi:1-deoxy-D-xylulose-5-phosphate reductoisomerase